MAQPITQCCPSAPNGQVYAYIDSSGNFFNVFTGTYMTVGSWTGGAVSGTYNKCALHQASPGVYGELEDPIDCPCCLPPYTFVQNNGCTNPSNLKDIIEPVPCIECICPEPEPFPECEDCVNPAVPIAFQHDIRFKTCEECEVQGEPRLTTNSKTNSFIAGSLIDPIVIFKLR